MEIVTDLQKLSWCFWKLRPLKAILNSLLIKDRVYGEVIILQAESMQKIFCDSSTPKNYVAIWKIRDSKRDKELQ